MTATRLTLTVDVLDFGPLYTAGMAVGLLRGAGLTITGVVVDDEQDDDLAMTDAEVEQFEQWKAERWPEPVGDIGAEDLPADVTPATDGTSWAGLVEAYERWKAEGWPQPGAPTIDSSTSSEEAEPEAPQVVATATVTPGTRTRAFLAHLHANGGAITDPDGHALNADLADALGFPTWHAFRLAAGKALRKGLITQDATGATQARRIYRVALTPAGSAYLDLPHPEPVEPEPEAPDEEPVTFTVDERPGPTATDDPARRFEERLARRRPPERRNFGTQPAPAGPRPVFPTVGPIERRPFNPDDVRYQSIENANPR